MKILLLICIFLLASPITIATYQDNVIVIFESEGLLDYENRLNRLNTVNSQQDSINTLDTNFKSIKTLTQEHNLRIEQLIALNNINFENTNSIQTNSVENKEIPVEKRFENITSIENMFFGAIITGIEDESILDEITQLFENVTIIEDKPIRTFVSPTTKELLELTPQGIDIGSSQLTGEGVKVAVLDTGIDYSHEDFGSCSSFSNCPKIIDYYDFGNNDNFPLDLNSHGTHVASTIASNNPDDDFKGIAPESSLMIYKVFTDEGIGTLTMLTNGLERAIDPNSDGDFSDSADIISLSLGSDDSDPNSEINKEIDAIVESGVVVVAAAGNEGSGLQTISSPGAARKVITVGATFKDDENYGFQSGNPDEIADFSSRGPTDIGTIKPDIVAPGVNICAALLSYATGVSGCEGSDNHFSISGTSMATPIVSGVIALLKEHNPDLTPDEIKSILKMSSKELGESVFLQGYGRIQPQEAFKYADNSPCIVEFDTSNLNSYTVNSREYSIDAQISCSDFSHATLMISTLDSNYEIELLTSIMEIDSQGIQTLSFKIPYITPQDLLLEVEVYSSSQEKVAADNLYMEYTYSGNSIDSCITITQQGDYFLEEDIVIEQGQEMCIEIYSDDVVLDCQGYSVVAENISSSISSSNKAIDVSSNKDVSILNCNIENFHTGISIDDVEDFSIEHTQIIQLDSSSFTSSSTSPSYAVYVVDSENGVLENITSNEEFYFSNAYSILALELNPYELYSLDDVNALNSVTLASSTLSLTNSTISQINFEEGHSCSGLTLDTVSNGFNGQQYIFNQTTFSEFKGDNINDSIIFCGIENKEIENLSFLNSTLKVYESSHTSFSNLNFDNSIYPVMIYNSSHINISNSIFNGVVGLDIKDSSSLLLDSVVYNKIHSDTYNDTYSLDMVIDNSTQVVFSNSTYHLGVALRVEDTQNFSILHSFFGNGSIVEIFHTDIISFLNVTVENPYYFFEEIGSVTIEGSNFSQLDSFENSSLVPLTGIFFSSLDDLTLYNNLFNISLFSGEDIKAGGVSENTFTSSDIDISNFSASLNYTKNGINRGNYWKYINCTSVKEEYFHHYCTNPNSYTPNVDNTIAVDYAPLIESYNVPYLNYSNIVNHSTIITPKESIDIELEFNNSQVSSVTILTEDEYFDMSPFIENNRIESILPLSYGMQNISIVYESEFGIIKSELYSINVSPQFEGTVGDEDGDSIDDEVDTVIGNVSNVVSNVDDLLFEVNGSTDLDKIFNSTLNVSFTNGDVPLVEFTNNFSQNTLHLNSVQIRQSSTLDNSKLIVSGLDLEDENTKTVYIELTGDISQFGSLCIKDAIVSDFSDISSNCDGADEIYIQSLPYSSNGYEVEYETNYDSQLSSSSNSLVKVSGLTHSGISQMCTENWEYTSWSSCSNDEQTRTAIDLNNCGTSHSLETLTQSCSSNDDSDDDSDDDSGSSSSGSSGGGGGGGSSGGSSSSSDDDSDEEDSNDNDSNDDNDNNEESDETEEVDENNGYEENWEPDVDNNVNIRKVDENEVRDAQMLQEGSQEELNSQHNEQNTLDSIVLEGSLAQDSTEETSENEPSTFLIVAVMMGSFLCSILAIFLLRR